MNEFKIYIIIGILLLISLLIYESYNPIGKSYSNAFEISALNGSQYNIPRLDNSSLFVINPKNSTIIFYKNFYSFVLSPFINNIKSIELTPKNNTSYSIVYGNQVCYSPVVGENVTFYYNPLNYTLTTYCFNKTINNYVFESFNAKINSISSSPSSQIFIFYNENPSISKLSLLYNNSVNFYAPFKISCKSQSSTSHIYLFDNYGNKTESSNGTATLSILAYPNLNVTCYDGEKIITESISFKKIVPILSLTYNNNKIYCNSTVESEIYLQVGNEQVVGFGSVSYGGSNIHGTITCTQPGNQYQEKETKSINIV